MKAESLLSPSSNFITAIPWAQCASQSGGSSLESSQLVCQEIGSSCISMGAGMLPGQPGPVLTGFPKLLPQELLQGHPLTSPKPGWSDHHESRAAVTWQKQSRLTFLWALKLGTAWSDMWNSTKVLSSHAVLTVGLSQTSIYQNKDEPGPCLVED